VNFMNDILLSDDEFEACWTSKYLKRPDRSGIVRGKRYSMSAKIGGRMTLSTVMAEGKPYQRTLKNGKKVWVVDVFGYCIKGPVYVTKLLERCEEGQNG
tara:strand:+ start:229 stop:525 length:297 start_codon:yes stop_codon:yes gene_type:complete